MLRRAAVLGATAHVASRRGQEKAMAAQEQQEAAPPQAAPEPAPAPAPAAGASSAGGYDELMRLKGLLDAGVLTQAEFDAQKQLVLGS
jgi:3-oxoacyl-ACP reductase-like protein